jgi:hypothetical protein
LKIYTERLNLPYLSLFKYFGDILEKRALKFLPSLLGEDFGLKVEDWLMRKYLKVAPEKGSCSCDLSHFTSGWVMPKRGL